MYNFASQIQQPQAQNPLAQAAQFSQIQNGQTQNALAQAQLNGVNKAQADQDALTAKLQALGPGATASDAANAAMGLGQVSNALAFQKSDMENKVAGSTLAKNTADAEKTKYETAKAQIGGVISSLAVANDRQSAMDLLDAAGKSHQIDQAHVDQMKASIPTDPAQFGAWRQQSLMSSLNGVDQVHAAEKQTELKQTALRDQQSNTIAQGNLGVAQTNAQTQQGQLGVAQGNSKEAARHNLATEGTAQQNANTEQVKALQAAGNVTEAQAKGAMYGQRLKAVEPIITNLQNSKNVNLPMVTAANADSVLTNLKNWAVNNKSTPEERQLAQAILDGTTAIARPQSGAAIGAQELIKFMTQYMPQDGDDKVTLAQKANNRMREANGLQVMAGPAWALNEKLNANLPALPMNSNPTVSNGMPGVNVAPSANRGQPTGGTAPIGTPTPVAGQPGWSVQVH